MRKTALMTLLMSICYASLISENMAYAEPNTVIDTIPVGTRPLGLAVDEVHNKIYVTKK